MNSNRVLALVCFAGSLVVAFGVLPITIWLFMPGAGLGEYLAIIAVVCYNLVMIGAIYGLAILGFQLWKDG